MGAIGNLIAGAANLGGTALQYHYNKQLQEQARRENYMYNEMAAESAFERQKEMQKILQDYTYKQYYDLESPKAIIQQLKDAGLSPSIMANGTLGGNVSGVSVASGTQGAGASGLSAIPFNMNAGEFADIALKLAQTKKVEQETKTEEQNTTKTIAETAKIWADKGLTDASKLLTDANARLTNIQADIADKTKENVIAKSFYETDKAYEESKKAVWEAISANAAAKLDTESIELKLEKLKKENRLLDVDALLRKSEIKLNDARRNEIVEEIKKWQTELQQGWSDLAVKAFDAKTKRDFNKIVDDYYDALEDNLKNRLDFDKEKFGKENFREWVRIIGTLLNDANANSIQFIGEVLPW